MDILKEFKLSREELGDIINNLKYVLNTEKEIQKFIRYILRIENKDVIILICKNVKLIELFNDKVDIDLLMIIKRNHKVFIEFLKIKQLQNILINDFDIVEDIIKKYSIKHILYFYNESKKNIPNFDEKFNNDNLDLFYTCLLDKYFINSFGVNTLNVNPIYINSNNISDNDNIEIDPKNYFMNNNQNFKFPNVIVDYNNDEGRDVALILDTYKEQILEKIKDITMNRVYKIEQSGKVYYIQITFNSIDKKYLIFIFEYFENYDQLILFKPPLKDIYAEYLQLMNTPIYVCIAYRDIELNETNSNEKIFVQDKLIFYKEYRYYGNFLTTSTQYRHQYILYLLFYIYGLILRNIELIYDKNSFGMELNEYFVLRLDNATDIPHKHCPYCKIGFKLAKSYLPSNNNEVYNITNSLNLNTFKNIIANRDIYYLNNQYTLANLNYSNSNLLSNIHSYYIHYFNPSLTHLDTFIKNKLQSTNQTTIAYNIVFNSNFDENIIVDLQRYIPKHLLNKDIVIEFQNYTKESKSEKIKEHYRKIKLKYITINVE